MRRHPLVRGVAVVGILAVGSGAAAACSAATQRSEIGSPVRAPVPPSDPAARGVPERLALRVLDRHHHDDTAFTEGLVFHSRGRLFESLGLDGRSAIREVDPLTGSVRIERRLDGSLFGEGIAIGPDGLVQLTWKNHVALSWRLPDLGVGPRYRYSGEGWGLTFDGRRFIQSNGSATLTFRDRSSFAEVSHVEVTRDGRPADQLNELEFVDGVVYSNVWHSDEILRIDPASGRVTGVIDASGLWTSAERTSEMTLNGIAHRPGDPADELWLTGKNWPELGLTQDTSYL